MFAHNFFARERSAINTVVSTFFSVFLVASTGRAVESPAETKFTLLNPTPSSLMRSLSADRPDVTESPKTVDAGHFQLEVSFFDYTRDDWNDDDTKVETWMFGSSTIKLGLLHNTDLQVVLDPYVDHKVEPDHSGRDDSVYGFGDTQIRVKTNLWGNDHGDTAAAVMPFIKIPTADDDLGNDHVEGGLIVPFSYDLNNGWGVGFMAEFDAVYDEEEHNHDFEFVHSAVIGKDLFGGLGWYGEYIGIKSSDDDLHYRAYAATGLTLGITESLQLDAGTNIGLTEASDDINVFAGMTLRL